MDIEVRNPATGALTGKVAASTEDEIVRLGTAARDAQKRWSAIPIRDRARVLIRFHDLVLDNQNHILDTIQSETGKSRRDAFSEILCVAGTTRYYAYHGPKHLVEESRSGAIPVLTSARIRRRPYSLVGLITPWNYPFLLGIADAIPALVAGCGVLLKPSERTPLSAELGRALLLEAGIESNLISLIHGTGPQATALIDQVDYVAFTGGGPTGRKVGTAAAERMIACSLELGGKNPMIVLKGARLTDAVEAMIVAAFANAGQACVGMERVFVDRSLYDRFLALASERTAQLKLGWSRDWDTDIGSLISPDHLNHVRNHVDAAVGHGAQIVIGGRERPGLGPAFFEPTILTDVSPQSHSYTEETFGPVVSVYPFDTVEEAIERANESAFGLNASIWGGTRSQAIEIARQLETGSVGIRSALQIYNSFDVPMGGTKASGIGRRHGKEGIQRFTQAQSIVNCPTWFGGYDGIWSQLKSPGAARIMGAALRVWRRLPGIR